MVFTLLDKNLNLDESETLISFSCVKSKAAADAAPGIEASFFNDDNKFSIALSNTQ